uniref:Ig-like domain-containing protein n=1 Tax=Catagonus wagneri TaxID=51154 RepID=A0A8C3VZW2_9CETA
LLFIVMPALPSLNITLIFAGDARGQTVTQPDDHILVDEGKSLELRCNYSYGATPYLFWYVQYPSQGLRLLLKYFSGDTLVQGIKGFEAEFKRTESSFNLKKSAAHWSDSAEYFCVVSDTVAGIAGGAEHKPLMVVEFLETQDLFLYLKDLLLYGGK